MSQKLGIEVCRRTQIQVFATSEKCFEQTKLNGRHPLKRKYSRRTKANHERDLYILKHNVKIEHLINHPF